MGKVRGRTGSRRLAVGVAVLVVMLALVLGGCPAPTGPQDGPDPPVDNGDDTNGDNNGDDNNGDDNNDDDNNDDDDNGDDNNDDNDDDNDNSDLPPTYGVTYHPNGADAGSVPEDAAVYESGDTVTVLGDTGGLTRTDHTFSGWNSAADQGGTTYQAGDTIPVVDADIDLYAVWTPGGIVHIDFQNPDDPEILFAGAGDQVLKGAELAISVGGSYTGHEWYLDGSDTHTALTADGASATIATGDLGYGTHTVSLFVSGGYSASFSFDVVDTVQ